MKRPWMPLYVNDLLDDPNVVKMTLEEFGAYMKLICYNWNQRGIPSDTRVLASMLRVNHRTFSRIWPTLSPLFPEINAGLLGNDRVMNELSSADEKSENYSKSAKEREARTKILGVTDHNKADHNTSDKKETVASATPSLPFSVDQAIGFLAAGNRFAATKANKGQAINIVGLIKKYPEESTWTLVGEWLGAGGESWRTELDVRSIGSFPQWVTHAEKWKSDGRPAIGQKQMSLRALPKSTSVNDESRAKRKF